MELCPITHEVCLIHPSGDFDFNCGWNCYDFQAFKRRMEEMADWPDAETEQDDEGTILEKLRARVEEIKESRYDYGHSSFKVRCYQIVIKDMKEA